jgi:hypothetical protein
MVPEARFCVVRRNEVIWRQPPSGGMCIVGEDKMVIKRIGVLKLAIFQAALMAAFGLIAALFFLLFGSMFAGRVGMGGGVFALILFPILYGIIGFIAGAISAALYNLVAGIVGGIEIDVE